MKPIPGAHSGGVRGELGPLGLAIARGFLRLVLDSLKGKSNPPFVPEVSHLAAKSESEFLLLATRLQTTPVVCLWSGLTLQTPVGDSYN